MALERICKILVVGCVMLLTSILQFHHHDCNIQIPNHAIHDISVLHFFDNECCKTEDNNHHHKNNDDNCSLRLEQVCRLQKIDNAHHVAIDLHLDCLCSFDYLTCKQTSSIAVIPVKTNDSEAVPGFSHCYSLRAPPSII